MTAALYVDDNVNENYASKWRLIAVGDCWLIATAALVKSCAAAVKTGKGRILSWIRPFRVNIKLLFCL